MPTTMSELKGHPLLVDRLFPPFSEWLFFRYVLEKDLLKFEAIYPQDTNPVGKIGQNRQREYSIYPRSAVHKLEGSLNWIKQARTIKEGEKPYKVVKARPKMKVPKEMRTPLTLDLYGYWQTETYVPPKVVNVGGKILFKVEHTI